MWMHSGESGHSWMRAQNLLEDKYILGMGDSEIGKAFGVSAASVRMMLTRARSKARKAMEAEFGGK